ncbi:MAG: methionine biosynthesis protein MetW, partial [Gammaproteobacteria bacterium]
GIRVLDRAVVDVTHRETGLMRLAPNLLGEIAIYRLCRQPA